ncbi:MAG TPA: hypothetical protein VHS09_17610 [Polyangiaceae bacterium]|nr:hypothetical protein [Polyangiaceae bacterium]
MLSLLRAARRSVLVASGGIALAGVLAGAVRLMPWLLDPAVPWRVAAPFARGLAAVAFEAALLVGWPVGWALAACRFVETGEARVLLMLGERPARTAWRLAPQGLVLAVGLAAVALVYGSDATAPGRVATELVAQARVACVRATAPTTYAIPFTDLTWLCAPDRAPRLVGQAPGAMRGAVLTAADARIAGDFRALDLDDARLLLAGETPVAVHVAALSIHGMPPWAQASTLPPAWRALVLALTAWSAALLAAYVVLRGGVRARVVALLLGAAGPLAALGLLRLLERADAHPPLFALLPLAACALLAGLALAAELARLRHPRRAASSSSRV